jgi:hypothetical protein
VPPKSRTQSDDKFAPRTQADDKFAPHTHITSPTPEPPELPTVSNSASMDSDVTVLFTRPPLPQASAAPQPAARPASGTSLPIFFLFFFQERAPSICTMQVNRQ